MSDYRKRHLGKGRGLLYDKRFRGNRAGFYWQQFEKPFLQRFLPELAKEKNMRVLDFACGTGRITQLLNQHFPEVIGIDLSGDMLAEARRKLPRVRFIEHDLTVEPINLEPFDLITAFRFFLNAEKQLREETLAALLPMLRKGGYFLLNNHLRAESFNGMLARSGRYSGLFKRNFLSDTEFESFLESYAFRVKKVYSYCLLPGLDRFPPINQRLWLRLETMLARIPGIQRFAEQVIYLCQK